MKTHDEYMEDFRREHGDYYYTHGFYTALAELRIYELTCPNGHQFLSYYVDDISKILKLSVED